VLVAPQVNVRYISTIAWSWPNVTVPHFFSRPQAPEVRFG
jgi:hypothetical protein